MGPINQSLIQAGFALEIIIESGLGHLRLIDYLLYRRPRIAAVRKTSEGGFQNSLACRGIRLIWQPTPRIRLERRMSIAKMLIRGMPQWSADGLVRAIEPTATRGRGRPRSASLRIQTECKKGDGRSDRI